MENDMSFDTHANDSKRFLLRRDGPRRRNRNKTSYAAHIRIVLLYFHIPQVLCCNIWVKY